MHAFSILILLPATALALVVPPTTINTKSSFQTTPSLSRRAPEKAETRGPEPMAVGPNGVDPHYSVNCPDGAAAGCNNPKGHFRERRRRRRRALQPRPTPSPKLEPAAFTKGPILKRDEQRPAVPGGSLDRGSSPYRRRRALHARPVAVEKKAVKRSIADDDGF